jgi:hypothetical protein
MKGSSAIAFLARILIFLTILLGAEMATGDEHREASITAMTVKEFRESSSESRFGYIAGVKDTSEFLANNSYRRVTRIDKAMADCIKLISVPRLQELAERQTASAVVSTPEIPAHSVVQAAWMLACKLDNLTAPLAPAQ